MSRIEGTHRLLATRPSSFLTNLERTLQTKYLSILRYEEIFWKQKYKIQWLNQSDSNTKFFHISTKIRRRKNKILSLKDDVGNWMFDQNAIVGHISEYFQNLFTNDHSTSIPHKFTFEHLRKISIWDGNVLIEPVFIQETKEVIFSFKSF